MLTLLCLTFSFVARAANLTSSTYFYASEGSNLTFTLTAAADTGDLFFRLVAPGNYDWVSIGIGSTMKDSLFLMAYPTQNSTGTSYPALETALGYLIIVSHYMVTTTVNRKL
jgi:cellobiose dehydrogenase-like cytochrome